MIGLKGGRCAHTTEPLKGLAGDRRLSRTYGDDAGDYAGVRGGGAGPIVAQQAADPKGQFKRSPV